MIGLPPERVIGFTGMRTYTHFPETRYRWTGNSRSGYSGVRPFIFLRSGSRSASLNWLFPLASCTLLFVRALVSPHLVTVRFRPVLQGKPPLPALVCLRVGRGFTDASRGGFRPRQDGFSRGCGNRAKDRIYTQFPETRYSQAGNSRSGPSGFWLFWSLSPCSGPARAVLIVPDGSHLIVFVSIVPVSVQAHSTGVY